MPEFRIASVSVASIWFVYRADDYAVLHKGELHECCRWRNVWGHVHAWDEPKEFLSKEVIQCLT